MIDKLIVQDREDLERDTYSKAILSRDINKLKEHKEKKAFFQDLLRQKDEINKLKKSVDDLHVMKDDIAELKDLLNQFIKRDN
jgi:hypothetical protein